MGFASLRNKLDNLIWRYEEVPDSPDEQATAKTPVAVSAGRRTSASASASASVSPSIDVASVEDFLGALREGTDDDRTEGHKKFWAQLEALQKVSMPEGTRYQSAAATAQGVTADDLLKSIAAVEAEIPKEEKDFSDRLAAVEQEGIGESRNRLEAIDGQLEMLQKQVAELEGERSTLTRNISVAEQKFKQQRADFTEAVRRFRQELVTERTNIKTHLGLQQGG